MWTIIGILVIFYIAWLSGEHHASRARRIIENNKVERRKKWRDQEKLIRRLKARIEQLESLLRRTKK